MPRYIPTNGRQRGFARIRARLCRHFGVNPRTHLILAFLESHARRAVETHYRRVQAIISKPCAKNRELIKRERERFSASKAKFDASIAKWKHEVERFEAIWPKHLRAERGKKRASYVSIDEI